MFLSALHKPRFILAFRRFWGRATNFSSSSSSSSWFWSLQVKFSAARTTLCACISVYHSPWVVINSWLALLILFAIWKGRPQHINQKVEHPKVQKAWMNWNCTLTPSTCTYIIAGACSFIAAMPRYRSLRRSLHQLFRATTAEGTFWDTLLTMSCCYMLLNNSKPPLNSISAIFGQSVI